MKESKALLIASAEEYRSAGSAAMALRQIRRNPAGTLRSFNAVAS